MKKCSTSPYLSAVVWLTIGSMGLYLLFTGFNLNELLMAVRVLLAPAILLFIALPTLVLGSYYLKKAFLGKKERQHIRFF